MNTYELLAHVGKRVINPGGKGGCRHLLEHLRPAPGEHLLEIGCGTGHAACDIAERYGVRVTAVDISASMVTQAREVARRRGLEDQVTFVVGDVQSLPWSKGAFDAVLAQAVLMFVDQPKAVGEIARVLRPGGRFAGLEFSWRQPPPAELREATYRICGCTRLLFHDTEGWRGQAERGGLSEVTARERPFTMLSIPGFVRDEGLVNSLRIGAKMFRRANRQRMREIWGHFASSADYFSYTVITGTRVGSAALPPE